MRWFVKFLMSAIILSLVACAKPLPPEKINYAGHWVAPQMSLLITHDGRMVYHRKEGNTRKSINSPIKEFHGNDIEVGIGSLTTIFVVSVPPHKINGQWKMTVDGVELTKQNEILKENEDE